MSPGTRLSFVFSQPRFFFVSLMPSDASALSALMTTFRGGR